MKNKNNIDDAEEETLQMLKEKGIIFKGTSKAFSTFLVLWFLSKKDMHGYLIMKQIDELFQPQISLGLMKPTKANKIYPLLKKMREDNLIEAYEGIHKKKDVKIYRLTDEGYKLLELIKNQILRTIEQGIWKELFDDLKIN